MHVIFAGFGEYVGFEHCVKAARARSNCPVHVLTDIPNFIPGSVTVNSDKYRVSMAHVLEVMELNKPKLAELNFLSQMRWAAASNYVIENKLEGPILVCDWDVVLFSDINDACKELLDFDVCMSMEIDTTWSAAYLIKSTDILHEYCSFVLEEAKDPKYLEGGFYLNDMDVWYKFTEQFQVSRGNMATIYRGGVFDHNIHCGKGKYQFDGNAKKITWRDGCPFFHLLDGTTVKAHSIHCWGEFKTKEAKLLKLADIL